MVVILPGKKKEKKIIKMDGTEQVFNEDKIIQSCINAGVPEDVARDIAAKVSENVKEGTTTREIRAMVLEELEERNKEWYDNWVYYDRIVKKRITYEKGKFVEIKKGNLYLGREVQDIGPKGISHLDEVKGILRELEEDLEHGIPKKKINSRTFILYMAVLKSKNLKKDDKVEAIKLINEFRKKQGWKPFKPKKPIK